MKLASLRVRVTAWYAGLLATALIVLGAAVFFGLRSYLLSSLQRSLREEATNIVQQFVGHVEAKGTAWLTIEIEESYAPESDEQYIRILEDGRLLYRSRSSQAEEIDASKAALSEPKGSAGYFREIHGRGGPILLYTEPFVSASGKSYLIQVGRSMANANRILRSLLIALCTLTPLILLGAAVGGFLLMSVPFRPVVELTLQAEQIGKKELGERLPVIATGDELERLSVSLNRMIDRLEDALAHNHRFSADVSHELRTPLTIMRGELEPLVQEKGMRPAALEAVGSALEEIDRMSDIVESLLAISRLDSPNRLTRTPVELNALVLSSVEQMQLLADDKHLRVQTDSPSNIWVLGDRVRLQQLIVDLLDNAYKYTSAGGLVRVTTAIQRSRAILEVSDTGVGIPAECLPFVFDRFYRADKARSRESGGTGLGLSIVKAICTAHDGIVSIQSEEGRGTVVRVELPACSNEEVARREEESRALIESASTLAATTEPAIGAVEQPTAF